MKLFFKFTINPADQTVGGHYIYINISVRTLNIFKIWRSRNNLRANIDFNTKELLRIPSDCYKK